MVRITVDNLYVTGGICLTACRDGHKDKAQTETDSMYESNGRPL